MPIICVVCRVETTAPRRTTWHSTVLTETSAPCGRGRRLRITVTQRYAAADVWIYLTNAPLNPAAHISAPVYLTNRRTTVGDILRPDGGRELCYVTSVRHGTTRIWGLHFFSPPAGTAPGGQTRPPRRRPDGFDDAQCFHSSNDSAVSLFGCSRLSDETKGWTLHSRKQFEPVFSCLLPSAVFVLVCVCVKQGSGFKWCSHHVVASLHSLTRRATKYSLLAPSATHTHTHTVSFCIALTTVVDCSVFFLEK